jgi:hypothetical protein
MKLHLGLRTLAPLAIVAASTAVLARPELIGGSAAATSPAIASMLAVGHS